MAHPPEESLLANVSPELRQRPEARRAAELVVALQGEAAVGDPFETFEALDALPADVVRAVLSSWTGAAPDPEALDEATRRAHGFPLPPLRLRVLRAMRPVSAAALPAIAPIAAEQVRVAGRAWDGRDLVAAERLAGKGQDAFADTLEVRWLVDAAGGARVADVVSYGGDSGTVFLANTAIVAGAIAYGVVEARDARLRSAIQAALALSATVEEVEPPPPPPAPEPEAEDMAASLAEYARVPSAEPETEEDDLAREARLGRELRGARRDEPARPVRKELAAKIDALTAEVDALAARISSTDVTEAARGGKTAKKAGAKKATAKAAAAEKPAAPKKAAAKKASAKKASAKAAAKTTTAKKASAKKATAKAAAEKAAAPKATAKKATAKAAKTTTAKKASAKKATAKAAAKKTTAKKAAVEKAPAKKATAKKAAAKKTTTAKKVAAKKTAAKKTTARKK